MKTIKELFYDVVEQSKTETPNEEQKSENSDVKVKVVTFTTAFDNFISDMIGYKGTRFLRSNSGMKGLINVLYTADVIASKMGSKMVDVDGEMYAITDYQFPQNWKDVIRAGRIYTTSHARETDVQKFDTVQPIPTISTVGGVEYKARIISPSAVKSFFENLFQDSKEILKLAELECTPLALTDFKQLLSPKSESNLVDFVFGAEISEKVAVIRGLKSPFEDDYDTTVEVPSKQEVMRWLML